MEFQYHGGNCVSISTKNSRIVVDDNLKELGLKSVTKPTDIALFTTVPEKLPEVRIAFADPGEYEISGVSIFGFGVRGFMDEEGQQTATIFKLQYEDTKVAIIGHIHPDISEEYLEDLGAIDILIIPVGGNGYTLDGVHALSIIKKIEPKITIPTHYEDSGTNYPVPQQPLSEAIKAFDTEPKGKLVKFKPKPADYTEIQQVVVLERS